MCCSHTLHCYVIVDEKHCLLVRGLKHPPFPPLSYYSACVLLSAYFWGLTAWRSTCLTLSMALVATPTLADF